MKQLTIVMYHYVRDVERTPYRGIKALSVSGFTGQLDYLERHYSFVTAADVMVAARGAADGFPDNAVLLTFDDGHSDHFDTVFPILEARGIQGVFFPSAAPVVERRVLAANKVQFILSQTPDVGALVDAVKGAVQEHRSEFELDPIEDYWRAYGVASRYDPAEVIFIKRMLQFVLPEALRQRVTDALFAERVSADEAGFADELYMNRAELCTMIEAGMIVGCHGYDHCWMDQLSPDEQDREISRSLDFLVSLGVSTDEWVMCYPFGAYDDGLTELVARRGCGLGVTTEPTVAGLGAHDPLLLPRLDTNDLPTTADAPFPH